MWKLFLDDVRDPPDETWLVARSYEEAVQLVEQFGYPTQVSFDHDIGDEEKTGMDFAHYLVELDIEAQVDRIQNLQDDDLVERLMPADFSFTVHSANPVGGQNIEELLERYVRWRKEESDELA